jgi:hypothetical protein
VLGTTCFFAASIVWANGSIDSGIKYGLPPVLRDRPPRGFHHLVKHPPKQKSIRPPNAVRGRSLQLLIHNSHAMIAAPVQSDVDGIRSGRIGSDDRSMKSICI